MFYSRNKFIFFPCPNYEMKQKANAQITGVLQQKSERERRRKNGHSLQISLLDIYCERGGAGRRRRALCVSTISRKKPSRCHCTVDLCTIYIYSSTWRHNDLLSYSLLHYRSGWHGASACTCALPASLSGQNIPWI